MDIKSFVQDFEIIDFHTHPFNNLDTNICSYKNYYDMKWQDIPSVMRGFGISKMCGSYFHVSGKENFSNVMEQIKFENREALKLRDALDGFYVPGFHIHPDYVEESLEEIEMMHGEGVRLMGELVPYMHGWKMYNHEGLDAILDLCAKYSIVVNFHEMSSDSATEMVKNHPDVMFVAAHPNERDGVLMHVDRMMKYDNVCLDISGTGIFRYHAIKYVVDKVGVDRVLFGTDYPVCNPGVYIGGLLSEGFTDSQLESIFSLNAKRLLGI